MRKIFAENLRTLRFAMGWTQKIVCKKMGISPAAYSKLETAATDPPLSRVEQIAKIYNIRGDTLFVPIDIIKKRNNSIDTINGKKA